MGVSFTIVVTPEQRREALLRAVRNSDVKVRLTTSQLRFLEQAERCAERDDRGR